MENREEQERRQFWRTIIISMILMVGMAIFIIHLKNKKEESKRKKEPTVYQIQ